MSDRSSSRAGTPSSASSHAQAISPRNRTLSNTSIGGESSVGQASGTVAAEVAVTVGDGQMPVDGDGDGHTAQVQVVNGGHGGHESACNEVEDMDRLLKKLDMEKVCNHSTMASSQLVNVTRTARHVMSYHVASLSLSACAALMATTENDRPATTP